MVDVGAGVFVAPPAVTEGTTAVLVRVAVFVGPEVGGVVPGVFVGIVVLVRVGVEVLTAVVGEGVEEAQPAPLGRPAMVTV